MARGRCGKSFVRGDQASPFCQGGGEVKAVVNRLIEVEGYRVRGGDITGRRQQLERRRLDRGEGRSGENHE